jgi:putative ABC transport system permease protein
VSAPPRGLGACWLLARRSLAVRAVSTAITTLSCALAAGLVMAVFVLAARTERAFTGGPVGFDAVLGARGSQLQLVLNSVFHLDTSPGNLPWSVVERVAADPRVRLAVPYAVGDSWRGHRIVGTTLERFELEDAPLGPRAGGRLFDPDLREAVVGSSVARQSGLWEGARFRPGHGVDPHASEHAAHEEEYVVVGVLEPTGTPSDRVIWIPLEGVLRMEGHVLRGAGEDYHPHPDEEIPAEHREVSAVMLRLASPAAGFRLASEINAGGTEATLAFPIGTAMAVLFDRLGWVVRVLELTAWLVVGVAAASILATLTAALEERRREFAVLRALGARRRTVLGVLLLESGAVATAGGLLGLGVFAGLATLAAALVRSHTGVALEPLAWHPVLAAAPAGMAVLGVLAGLWPGARACGTEVAGTLERS